MVTHYIPGHIAKGTVNNINIRTVNINKCNCHCNDSWFQPLPDIQSFNCGYSSFWGGLGMGLLNGLSALIMPMMSGSLFGGFGNSFGNMFGDWNNSIPYAPLNQNNSTQSQIDECLQKIKALTEENAEIKAQLANKTGNGNGASGENGANGANGTGTASDANGANGANGTSGANGANGTVTASDAGGSYTDNTNITRINDLLEKINSSNGSITENDLTNISDNELKDANKEQATTILEKLGYTKDEGNNKIGKISNNYKVLLLLAASGLNVNVAHNTQASADDGYIRGKISDVKQENDGTITYTVDNSTVSGDYGLKYTFTGKNNDFRISQIENKSENTYYILNDITNRTYEYNAETHQIELNDEVLVSKHKADNRKEVKSNATYNET